MSFFVDLTGKITVQLERFKRKSLKNFSASLLQNNKKNTEMQKLYFSQNMIVKNN